MTSIKMTLPHTARLNRQRLTWHNRAATLALTLEGGCMAKAKSSFGSALKKGLKKAVKPAQKVTHKKRASKP